MPQFNSKVMAAPPEQDGFTFWKLLSIALSFLVGIIAKLATIYAKEGLDIKQGVLNVSLAALATWLVYHVCIAYQINIHATCVFIALSAKFSDAVIVMLFKVLKNFVEKFDTGE